MKTFSCPGCGAPVEFKSKSSIYSVCSFCKSMLIRHDVNLETLGKMAELTDDLTPFQIGTRGKYEGKRFELIGRLRIRWSDGFWNEWFAQFADGTEGWLAEAQGFLMMSFEEIPTPARPIPSRASFQKGATLTLGNRSQGFTVDDIKNAECVGSEGELPFTAPRGRKSVSIDLSAPNGAFATLDFGENEAPHLYIGEYVEFDSFGFSELREIDGW